MDNGFMEAAAAFWDKRVDTLAPVSRELDVAVQKSLNKLTDVLSNDEMNLYMEAEDEMNKREAAVKEFFYKTGFQDAVRFFQSVSPCKMPR